MPGHRHLFDVKIDWRLGRALGVIFACGCLLSFLACRRVRPNVDAVHIEVDLDARHQVIDGFGTTASVQHGTAAWFQDLYYRDLGASILRIDVTPTFAAPVSDFAYNAPWFHNAPALPGPDGNNVRTYRDVSDYSRDFAGKKAKIAVMGPDIERNIRLFDYETREVKARGELARRGEAERTRLGDFKLIASVWSPPPWLKVPSGRVIEDTFPNGPKAGTKWPFVWAGNFAGGKLDTSGEPRAEFDDSALGGSGKTSALTQFARGLAAYLLGFQRTYQTRFHTLSIQNELTFETFYNSCMYQTASEYEVTLRAVRSELAKHDELRNIKIMGPEDLLGDVYSLWSYGDPESPVTKNLGFLNAVLGNPTNAGLIDIACIHGYANDGVSSAGADAALWKQWAYGWKEVPQEGLPQRVRGFREFGKKSWMTETSGEQHAWLTEDGSFPSETAFGLALKIHQALTAGEQSAWLYWQLADEKKANPETLTDTVQRERAAKYVAAKHYFRFIRPGARRVGAFARENGSISVSAYLHERDNTLVLVVLNQSPEQVRADVSLPKAFADKPLEIFTSSERERFQHASVTVKRGHGAIDLPAFSVTTIRARR